MNSKGSSSYKYVILVSAVLLQACFGATYSWAVFVEPLKQMFHKGQAAAQLPFSIFYIFFPFTMIFSGYILDKIGIRKAVIGGIIIFGLGWILSGLFGRNIPMISLGIGLIGGIGVGIGYVIPIKLCVQWFPRHKGLATGLAVAGFGGGAAILSHLARYLMEVHGSSPLQVFKIFGGIYICVGILCGLLLKSPEAVESPQRSRVEIKSILRDKTFRLLYTGMFAGLFGGFAIIANLKQIFAHATPLMGATAVSFFAVFNALGRIIWGGIFDRTRGKGVIITNLMFQAFFLLSQSLFVKSPFSLYIFAGFAGFNYGGVLVLYASEAGHVWGAEKLPKIYGMIFSANIPASLSPVFAGYVYDISSGNFNLVFLLISIFITAISVLIYLTYQARPTY
jgi:OFA family oxalate/formate antiporter-like MFS transporter